MSLDIETETQAGQAPFDWRKHLPVHPAADEYPLLRDTDPAAFRALVEDIKQNGLRVPIATYSETDEAGRFLHVPLLLDGRNRLDALAVLGLLYETADHHLGLKNWNGKRWSDRGGRVEGQYIHGGDAYALAASLNAHRRHLEPEQYRARIEASHARIAAAIRQNPEKSLRAIGDETGTDKNTVGAVKAKMVATGEVHQLEKTVGKDGKARKHSPGFDAACAWAERLGRKLGQLGSGGFTLTMPDDAPPVCFHSLKRLNERLKEIEEEKDGAAAEASGEKAKHAALDEVVIGGVEDAAVTRANILDSIKQAKAVAEAWRKILKASSFDSGAKSEISDAIESLIRKWRAVQSTLAAKDDEPPSGPGGGPPPIEKSADLQEPSASPVADALMAPTPTIDHSLDIPACLLRTAEAAAPDAPIPLTPPAPASPSPTPAPSPTSPAPKLKVSPHYMPAHRDPWPKDWRSLNAAELEDVIHKTQAFGVNHRLEDRHHKQLARMRERLEVLWRADRAAARASTAAASGVSP